MPWTFAHPAAVLPLRPLCPQRLSFGALVVGSISPDIGYYVGWFELAAAAHTLLGLVTICLPSGVALTALVRVLHGPVAGLLPYRHRQAILSLPPMPLPHSPMSAWMICISILIGAMTHVGWDSFTHGTGYLTSRWLVLRIPVLVLFTRPMPVFDLLQHASSAVGAAIVLVAYVRWLHRVDRGTVAASHVGERWRYSLLGALAVTALMVAVPVAYFESSRLGRINVAVFVVRYVMSFTAVFVVLVTAASLLLARRIRDA
jgi:Domain of unknown function (DUF4184)